MTTAHTNINCIHNFLSIFFLLYSFLFIVLYVCDALLLSLADLLAFSFVVQDIVGCCDASYTHVDTFCGYNTAREKATKKSSKRRKTPESMSKFFLVLIRFVNTEFNIFILFFWAFFTSSCIHDCVFFLCLRVSSLRYFFLYFLLPFYFETKFIV